MGSERLQFFGIRTSGDQLTIIRESEKLLDPRPGRNADGAVEEFPVEGPGHRGEAFLVGLGEAIGEPAGHRLAVITEQVASDLFQTFPA